MFESKGALQHLGQGHIEIRYNRSDGLMCDCRWSMAFAVPAAGTDGFCCEVPVVKSRSSLPIGYGCCSENYHAVAQNSQLLEADKGLWL